MNIVMAVVVPPPPVVKGLTVGLMVWDCSTKRRPAPRWEPGDPSPTSGSREDGSGLVCWGEQTSLLLLCYAKGGGRGGVEKYLGHQLGLAGASGDLLLIKGIARWAKRDSERMDVLPTRLRNPACG